MNRDSIGYDSDGNRISKTTGLPSHPVTTYFLNAGSFPVGETDSTGHVTAINTQVSRMAGSVINYRLYDPQGTCAQMDSSSGTVTNNNFIDSIGMGSTAFTDPQSGYNGAFGYYTDNSGSSYVAGARIYFPALGRWLNRDPIGYGGGRNQYAYTGNEFEGESDPSGLIGLALPFPVFGGTAAPVEAGGAVIAAGGGPENPYADYAGAVVVGMVAGHALGNSIGNALFPAGAADPGISAAGGIPSTHGKPYSLSELMQAKGRGYTGDLPARIPPPGGVVRRPDGKQDRHYGPDGNAEKDIDRGHDHGQGDPHAHDWDWTGPRAKRLPGRCLLPGE